MTAADAHALGAIARGRTIHALAPPVGVLFTYNPKKSWLRIHVRRAPGMIATGVEVSSDPVTATSWVALEGVGAVRNIANPARGTWWARAQSLAAKAKSEFTTAVSCIVP